MVVGGGESGSCCSYGGAELVFYFIFFDSGGRQWLAVGVGLQRKWWVFRERERHR